MSALEQGAEITPIARTYQSRAYDFFKPKTGLDIERIKSIYSKFGEWNGKRFTVDFTNENTEQVPAGAIYLPPHFTALETFLIPWSLCVYEKKMKECDVDEFYSFRYPTDPLWMVGPIGSYIGSLGSEAVHKNPAETTIQSSIEAACGINYVLFMEAGHNRSHGTMKPKTGAYRIAARAQILRDALGIAKQFGEKEFREFAQHEGVTGWVMQHLQHDPSILAQDIVLVPTNTTFYPLLSVHANPLFHAIAKLAGKQPVKPIELIAHELSLHSRKPVVSVHIGQYVPVRNVLGEDYAQRFSHLQHHAKSLDDLALLLESPLYRIEGENAAYTSQFRDAIRQKTEHLMESIYRQMTWNMDHIGVMALERHVADGNGFISRTDLLGMFGDAMKTVLASGERCLPHISADAIDTLYRGWLTPAAERTIHTLEQLGILIKKWDDLYDVDKKILRYVPNGSARMLNPTEVIRNDLRRFNEVLEQYGLDLHIP